MKYAVKLCIVICVIVSLMSMSCMAAKEYTININLDGDCIKTVMCPDGNAIEFKPSTLSDGYMFLGWTNDADKVKVIYPGDYMMTPTDDMNWSIAYIKIPVKYVTPKLDGMTRLEVVTFILDCMYNTETIPSTFSDCNDTRIGVAKRIGLITGYPDGTFRPDQVLTGQEIGILMERFIMIGGK